MQLSFFVISVSTSSLAYHCVVAFSHAKAWLLGGAVRPCVDHKPVYHVKTRQQIARFYTTRWTTASSFSDQRSYPRSHGNTPGLHHCMARASNETWVAKTAKKKTINRYNSKTIEDRHKSYNGRLAVNRTPHVLSMTWPNCNAPPDVSPEKAVVRGPYHSFFRR